jgi:hypothetical protein
VIPEKVFSRTRSVFSSARPREFVLRGVRTAFFGASSRSASRILWLTIRLGIKGLRHLECREESGQDRPVSDDVVPHRATPPFPGAVILGDFSQMQRHADTIPRFAPAVGLIVVLLLSVGLWGAVWLVVSALGSVWPW